MPKKNTTLPQLTRAEETVMQALWQYEKALVKDIIAAMPEPKPHANTVNTVLKVLAEKGFVTSEPVGNANQYQALISKDAYSSKTISQFVKGYFNGSFNNLVSFFVAEKNLDINALEEILQTLKKQKK
jgi:predicted transcriptional regulator